MKIIIPVLKINKSGGARVLISLINGLASKGYDISLICPAGQYDEALELNCKVVEVKNPIHPKLKVLSRLSELILLWSNIPKECDYVIATYFLTVFPVVFKKCKGKKIYFVQGMETKIFNRSLFVLIKKIFAAITYKFKYDYIVTVSKWLSLELLKFNKNQKITVINPNVNEFFFTKEIGENNSEKKRIVTIGSNLKFKGTEDFLRACEMLTDNNIEVVIISQEEIKIDSKIEYKVLKPKNDKELKDIYKSAHILVSCSYLEGFGLPPLEAMLCNTPSVMYNSKGNLEYANNSVNCYMVEAGDIKGLTSKIELLLDDKSRYNSMILEGTKTASLFTQERMVENWTTKILVP